MRLMLVLAFAAGLLCTQAQAQNVPPPGAFHPITQAQVRAMAYAGCTEAGNDPNVLNEKYVQYSIYNRALKDRRAWGGSDLVRVTHQPGQYNGVEWRRACSPAEWRRSFAIAQEIVDGNFRLEPGWEDITNFMAPCYSTAGGKSGFYGLVYVGTKGGHDFYRERRPGERPRFVGCRQSKTYGWLPSRSFRIRPFPHFAFGR